MPFESFMRRDEAHGLVKTHGVRSQLVRSELHEMAALLARDVNGTLHQLLTDTVAAQRPRNTHAFDQAAPAAAIGQGGDKGQLQKAGDSIFVACNQQMVVGITEDL